MHPLTRVYLYKDNIKFFGEGPLRLLKLTEKTGSLRAAAQAMELSYSKATTMIKRAEECLGFPLTEKNIGGKGGGGSILTAEASAFIEKYEEYRKRCYEASEKIYAEVFGENKTNKKIACVLMASGLSSRFGSNKLLTKLKNKNLLDWAVNYTSSVNFEKRMLFTRNEEVYSYCKGQGIDAVKHELPNRNDAVKLAMSYMRDMDAVLFVQCDQPFVKCESIEKIINSYLSEGKGIHRLSFSGEAASPVLFSSEYFEELQTLPEKKGGGYVAKKHSDEVTLIEAENEYETFDVDTPEDLDVLEKLNL